MALRKARCGRYFWCVARTVRPVGLSAVRSTDPYEGRRQPVQVLEGGSSEKRENYTKH
jgi:hypothetical protein